MAESKALIFRFEQPITVDAAEIIPDTDFNFSGTKPGDLVAVRPCGPDNPDGRTMLGIYLGSLTVGHSAREETGRLVIRQRANPAMFVPELRRIVHGCESWWGPAKDPDQLRQITDELIASQPHMVFLRALAGQQEHAKDERLDKEWDDLGNTLNEMGEEEP